MFSSFYDVCDYILIMTYFPYVVHHMTSTYLFNSIMSLFILTFHERQ